METLDHSILVSGSISFTYHLIPRGKNHLNIAHIAFADGGNRTRAACAASECAIHYSIASRLCYQCNSSAFPLRCYHTDRRKRRNIIERLSGEKNMKIWRKERVEKQKQRSWNQFFAENEEKRKTSINIRLILIDAWFHNFTLTFKLTDLAQS